jgi:hypothetical protein
MTDFNAILPKTEEEYLQTRVLDQINWNDKKSAKNKNYFIGMKVTEIILALFIPFLSGYISTNADLLKIVIGMLGIVVAAIAGLITLIKYQENWIQCRTTAESLKFEKFLFLSKAGPYKDVDDPFPLFVERFENLIVSSTKKWVDFVSKKETKSTGSN